MITWSDFYNVMSAMVPLYVDMLLAYASVRWWKIFTPEQCVGINRFVAVFAVPLLSFHFLAANDPYNMNLRFLAGDTLQKVIILVVLLVWAHFSSRRDAMDWLITLFSVSTLPNTLIMGIPLLGGMYSSDAKALMIQIVVLQCIIWYTLLLFLFEYRAAMKLITERFPDNARAIASVTVESDVFSLRDGETDSHIDSEGRIHVTVRRSTSSYRSPGAVTPARSPFPPQASHPASGELYGFNPRISTFSSGEVFGSSYGLAELYGTPKAPFSPTAGGGDPSEAIRGRTATKPQSQVSIDIHDQHRFARSTSAPPAGSDWAMEGKELSFARGRGGFAGEEDRERMSNLGEIRSGEIGESPDTAMGRPPVMVMTGIILNMVWRKLIRNPNTYSSLLGLAWSLIEFRFDVRLPTIVENSIAILSTTGLGMAMFSLGLFMALQPKLIACGNWMALISFGVRFIFGPVFMALASLAVGLRGHLFKIAVVQAALPQGIVPFVFAKEYDLHPTILSTGVIFGLIVALPIDLLYYVLLEL